MAIKRVFVSDVHMSPGWSLPTPQRSYDWFSISQAQEFGAFLDKMITDKTIGEVILLGDLMDGWVYPIETKPPIYAETASALHIAPIMKKLRELARNKPVIYVIGNHDMTLAEAQFDNFRTTGLAGITFQDIYETPDGLFAAHGHQYTMYNAVDPKHDSKHKLPLGHYISRLAATVAERKNIRYSTADIAAIVRESCSAQLIASGLFDLLVNIPLNHLANELGNMGDKTQIKTVDGKKTTLAAIKQQYSRLAHDWGEEHGLLAPLQSIEWETEAVGLCGVADQIARGTLTSFNITVGKRYKVVIFGHTHKADIEYLQTPDLPTSPEPIDRYGIYANCGAWCLKKDEPTYVIDEYDQTTGEHKITLTYRDPANNIQLTI